MAASPKRHIQGRRYSVESAAVFLGFVSPSTVPSWLTHERMTQVEIGCLTRVSESEPSALIERQQKVSL